MIVDRYVAHGLHGNPFAVPSPGSNACRFFVDRNVPDPPPASSGTLVQVIGDKGAGKSTQLRNWRHRRPGPYHYVPSAPYRSRWARPPVAPLIYADEIDRMPAPLRRRWMQQLASAQATVVAGTHVDLARVASLAGLAVITHWFGPADLATVRAVLNGRVQQASTSQTAITFALTDAEIVDIHQRCHGSIRTAEILAHEVVAQRVHASDSSSSLPIILESQS